MQHRNDDEPMFEHGDQDYGSMTGWDPRDKMREKILADSRKKYPHLYQPVPQMFWVSKAGEFLDVGVRNGPMRQLFGPFWLEDEIAVFYAPPGYGKSALAVQIAECLARGVSIDPFTNTLEPQKVLYLDFEFTRAQFAHRYAVQAGEEFTDSYDFSDNFIHAEHSWYGEIPEGYKDFTDLLFTNIEGLIDASDATVMIVDNVSFLTHSSTANSVVAFRLMNRLQDLKRSRSISILVLAHTPKHAEHVPLSANDLQGSIDLAKVADSMFVMGRSGSKADIRYLKHIKSRSGKMNYGEDNVVVYRMAKFDLAKRIGCDPKAVRADNFLGLDFIGHDDERHHLSERPPLMPRKAVIGRRRRRRDRRLVAYARFLADQGMSAGSIADRLGIGRTTAFRYMRRYQKAAGGAA